MGVTRKRELNKEEKEGEGVKRRVKEKTKEGEEGKEPME